MNLWNVLFAKRFGHSGDFYDDLFAKALGEGGVQPIWLTASGVAPLLLPRAVSSPLRSLTQFGKTEQASTPTPSAPVDIMCNNGALRFGALGINLLDPNPSNVRLEYYINKADGEEKPSPYNFMFEGYMPVEAGKTYVAYGRAKTGNDLSDYNRVAWYDSTKTWISGADYTQNRIAVVTAPANAVYARFSCNPSGGTTQTVTQEYVASFDWMFAEGTAEITPFVPFDGGIYVDGTPEVLSIACNYASGDLSGYGTDGSLYCFRVSDIQTVSDIQMLLGVGDYKDEQEIISGLVTHKVGIKVLDGTESWALSDSGSTHRFRGTKPSDCHTPASRAPSVCTHFKYVSTGSAVGGMFIGASQYWYFIPTDQTIDTVDGWTAWLASQYALGTPVIVLYPLATETSESVTGHHLHTSAGTNVIDVTAEVSDITFEAEYKGYEEVSP